MVRSKTLDKFNARFPENKIDISILDDIDVIRILVYDDLKKNKISYRQIMNRYGITIKQARFLKFKIVNKIK